MSPTKIISEGLPPKPPLQQSAASPANTYNKLASKATRKLPEERPEATDFFTTIVYFFVLVTLIGQLALISVFDF